MESASTNHPRDRGLPHQFDVAETAARPMRRGHFQFHLRTLLALTSLVCVLLAAFAWWREWARRQAAAIAVLTRIGAEYEYENAANSRERPWLRYYLGDDFFFHVVTVRNDRRNARSASEIKEFWDAVAALPQLETLFAAQDWVTGDLPMKSIRQHRRLRELTLCEGTIYDENLRGIGRLKSLEYLSLAICPVGDETLAEAATLPNLRELKVYNTNVSDAGATHLATSKTLEVLWINNTQISDRGLHALGGCSKLRQLDVSRTSVTPAGIEHFKRACPTVDFQRNWHHSSRSHRAARPVNCLAPWCAAPFMPTD